MDIHKPGKNQGQSVCVVTLQLVYMGQPYYVRPIRNVMFAVCVEAAIYTSTTRGCYL